MSTEALSSLPGPAPEPAAGEGPNCAVSPGSVIATLEDGTEILHDEQTPTTRWTISRASTGKVSVTITQPTGIAHVTVGNLRLLLKMIEHENLSPNTQDVPGGGRPPSVGA